MDGEQTPEIKQHTVIHLHKPDTKEYLFYFISGVIISIPFTVFYETYADQFCFLLPVVASTLCSTVIFAPFIEEFAKAYLLFYRHGETQRSLLSLGFLAGLGFGITEFFLYIFVYKASIPIRIPGLLFHAASTTIVAYGITVKKPLGYYLIAVFLHFANNFFALLGTFWYIGGPVVLTLSFILAFFLYRQSKEIIVDNLT
jgi:RsiW-degrading membrane proteinase PrsW (M82 family)